MLSHSSRVSRRAAVNLRSTPRCPKRQSSLTTTRCNSTSTSTSTAASPASGLLPDEDAPHSQKETPIRRRKWAYRTVPNNDPGTRSAFIRLWQPVHNVADTWAIKQTLEKKYGPILEIHFFKDFEVFHKYQMIAFIVFRDQESFSRVPVEGEEFNVVASRVSKKISEITISDIEQYAGSTDYDPNFEFVKLGSEEAAERRIIRGDIKRAEYEFSRVVDHKNVQRDVPRQVMEHFLKWGGFNPDPVDTSKEVPISSLFRPSAFDENLRMAAALQYCADSNRTPIPKPASHGLNPLVGATSAVPSQSARVFAGLYDKGPPILGRPKEKKMDGEDVEEGTSFDEVLSEDSSSQSEESSATSPDSEAEPTPTKPSLPPKPQRTAPTAQERRDLANQINAARMLQRTVAPARRKQPKPPVVQTRKPGLHEWTPRPDQPLQTEALRVEEKPSVISKLWSLFGR